MAQQVIVTQMPTLQKSSSITAHSHANKSKTSKIIFLSATAYQLVKNPVNNNCKSLYALMTEFFIDGIIIENSYPGDTSEIQNTNIL